MYGTYVGLKEVGLATSDLLSQLPRNAKLPAVD